MLEERSSEVGYVFEIFVDVDVFNVASTKCLCWPFKCLMFVVLELIRLE